MSGTLGSWSRSRARFVFAGVGRRLGRRPRLATFVLRLPRRLPAGRLRSLLYRSFSWPLAKRLGTTGHVYAFEPSPTNYRALCRNLSRNRVENVTALEVAAGETAGKAILYEGPGTNTGRATLNSIPAERGGQRNEVAVEVRPVGASIPEEDLRRVRAIKIDVEGSEIEVLRSLEPLFELRERLAVFLEFTPSWADESAPDYVESVCTAHGFELYRLWSGYTLEGMFPSRIEPPARLSSVPREQCDLLLARP